ncbi:hypothetical protein HNR39_003605 [Glaciimonas immobilis]|uniref:Uncharacterized protein n=1 Tax=Glaciimonas immobilis TaxID=728004 RepID=A0A840RT92_9BURK|nr:hypothetical protein [Glaciimonas immobilis]
MKWQKRLRDVSTGPHNFLHDFKRMSDGIQRAHLLSFAYIQGFGFRGGNSAEILCLYRARLYSAKCILAALNSPSVIHHLGVENEQRSS